MQNDKKYCRGWNRQSSEYGFNWAGGPKELIRERAMRRQWSHQKLADKVKMITGQVLEADDIFMFEQGQLEPTGEQMQALAKAMELPSNWFVGEEQ